MKALSIRQPWAWAILRAGKRIENRERADGRMPSMCSYRGPLLIHVSAGCTTGEYNDAVLWMRQMRLISAFGADVTGLYSDGRVKIEDLADLPRGGIVGICNVVAHVEPTGAMRARPDGESGSPPGLGTLDFRWHKADSYGLVLADVRPLPFMPFNGALGLFDVPGATPEMVVEVATREGRIKP